MSVFWLHRHTKMLVSMSQIIRVQALGWSGRDVNTMLLTVSMLLSRYLLPAYLLVFDYFSGRTLSLTNKVTEELKQHTLVQSSFIGGLLGLGSIFVIFYQVISCLDFFYVLCLHLAPTLTPACTVGKYHVNFTQP